jgi:hypothetical protein
LPTKEVLPLSIVTESLGSVSASEDVLGLQELKNSIEIRRLFEITTIPLFII